MNKASITFNAKTLVRQQHSGVLSTHSVSVEGYPFGSIVPYFMTAEGSLIIYISDIAQHTRNIKQNAKVSMTIFDALEDDSQASGRVTVLGDAQLVSSVELMAQYLALFPQAARYQQTHDFNLYEIVPKRVRFIAGFGDIFWINQDHWAVEAKEWQQVSHGIIKHMNEDHQEAMALIIEHQFKRKTEALAMISVFQEGAHLRADAVTYYLSFSEPCINAQQVRQQLVSATHSARRALQIVEA